jgi:hypothetical protein
MVCTILKNKQKNTTIFNFLLQLGTEQASATRGHGYALREVCPSRYVWRGWEGREHFTSPRRSHRNWSTYELVTQRARSSRSTSLLKLFITKFSIEKTPRSSSCEFLCIMEKISSKNLRICEQPCPNGEPFGSGF